MDLPCSSQIEQCFQLFQRHHTCEPEVQPCGQQLMLTVADCCCKTCSLRRCSEMALYSAAAWAANVGKHTCMASCWRSSPGLALGHTNLG